jgi:hypothetical protein
MITEDYVSFETAKLLKEKGFDELCIFKYNSDGYRVKAGVVIDEWQNSELNDDECSCVSIQMVMKWLREVHKFLITIDWTGYENEYIWSIQDMNSGMYWESDESYILYEHACEAAFLFCLKKLI